MNSPIAPHPAQRPKTIAIACQGGGSHTAFTAGVLQTLLNELDTSRYRVHGLSGTSGGAMCAAIAWYSLLKGDPQCGAQWLESFWQDMTTTELPDTIANQWLVWLQRNHDYLPVPDVSPYLLPNTGQDFLAATIRRYVDFDELPALVSAASPTLMVGAVNVLSGRFTVFHSHTTTPEHGISAEALLASAAIPELFRAVTIGKGVYWDGLFSQNPPISGFLSGNRRQEDKPDEIWVIQINPEKRATEPKTGAEIVDRRNELAGNISLNQELNFVHRTNEWLRRKWLVADHIKHIDIRYIPLELELDYPSKLDRSPSFINAMLAEGRRTASKFLDKLDRLAAAESACVPQPEQSVAQK